MLLLSQPPFARDRYPSDGKSRSRKAAVQHDFTFCQGIDFLVQVPADDFQARKPCWPMPVPYRNHGMYFRTILRCFEPALPIKLRAAAVQCQSCLAILKSLSIFVPVMS
jgi:hypothetical protein